MFRINCFNHHHYSLLMNFILNDEKGVTNPFLRRKISTKPSNQSTRLLDDCFTMYLRSKLFRDQVIKSGIVRIEIPDAFINYIE
ncbi:MAG TPA: hypothetical protein VLL98_02095, partial [Rickettsiales bacterium]|nr:hypothetical protein [Rickettsiales bacterium]